MALVLPALFGAAVLAVAARWGLGLSPDSAVYVGAARSIISGRGFSLLADSGNFAPIIYYPPLYPLLLALPGSGGLDPVSVAKWLNILLFGANIFLAGTITFALTASLGATVITASLVATAFPMVMVHSMAWSEPLFIFFELWGIIFLLSYLRKPGYRSLVAAAGVIGLSVLSRYAGVAFVASAAVGILVLDSGLWKRRVVHAGAFLAVSLFPISLWLLRNWWAAGSATHRQFSFHPLGVDRVTDVINTIISWFTAFPHVSSWFQMLTVGLTVFGGLAFWLWGRRQAAGDESISPNRTKIITSLLALIVASYLLLLVVSISFLDAQIPVDTRILSPAYVAFGAPG